MPSGFEHKLTPLQIQKLDKIGIKSMYELITTFPYKLDLLVPFTPIKQAPNQKYLLNGFVQRFEIVARGRRFIKVDIAGQYNLQVYIFNTAPYILGMLNQKNEFQFIIENKNGFWTIEKFAEKKSIQKDRFILGQAEIKSYIIPKYLKNLAVVDSTFKAIHSRLTKPDYLLNLAGLVPQNNGLIPEIIDLSHIHHPTSTEQFYTTLNQFTSLKVFLRVALLKYINQISQQKHGLATKLDVEYLKQVTQQLPYSLSDSQKTTIWDILQDLAV
jgi:RecG-like helicase